MAQFQKSQYSEVGTLNNPKLLAQIKLCGAITINVDDTMPWIKPTAEQIKNLHDLFCIDVAILDSGE